MAKELNVTMPRLLVGLHGPLIRDLFGPNASSAKCI